MRATATTSDRIALSKCEAEVVFTRQKFGIERRSCVPFVCRHSSIQCNSNHEQPKPSLDHCFSQLFSSCVSRPFFCIPFRLSLEHIQLNMSTISHAHCTCMNLFFCRSNADEYVPHLTISFAECFSTNEHLLLLRPNLLLTTLVCLFVCALCCVCMLMMMQMHKEANV